jgi:hypothetical protein
MNPRLTALPDMRRDLGDIQNDLLDAMSTLDRQISKAGPVTMTSDLQPYADKATQAAKAYIEYVNGGMMEALL